MVALSIVNLSKRIGNDYLFRNLDIEVHEGEILCLSAPSGYGKTTLLKCIAGLTDHEGQIRLYGATPDTLGYTAWRTRVLYVPQRGGVVSGTPEEYWTRISSFAANKTKSVGIGVGVGHERRRLLVPYDNADDDDDTTYEHGIGDDNDEEIQLEVEPGRVRSGRSETELEGVDTGRSGSDVAGHPADRQGRDPASDPVAIAASWNVSHGTWSNPFATLSGGERQRVLLAMSLALAPDILLLDEPTSALDAATAALVERSVVSARITVVLVSHDAAQVQRLATRVFVLGPPPSPVSTLRHAHDQVEGQRQRHGDAQNVGTNQSLV